MDEVCRFAKMLFREEPSLAGSGSGRVKRAFPFGARQVKESSLPRVAPLQAFELSALAEIQVVPRSISSRPERMGAYFFEKG